MISILSPAKTLDMQVKYDIEPSNVRFNEETNTIVSVLSKYSPMRISKLMSISEKLSLLNADRYKSFDPSYPLDSSRPAMLCFNGGVYQGLASSDFTKEDFSYAQDHLRILSGLYGLLKPNDLIQAYRLEMGTKLKIKKSKNLYEFWGDKITKLLQEDIDKSGSDVLINLASNEYFRAIKTKSLGAKLINIIFKEYRNDELKIISFNAKKARGMMARYIIKNKINNESDLKGFNDDGYYFDEQKSDKDNWMFIK